MARLIWTEPALADLDAIADYIAIDNPTAATDFVKRTFRHVEQLEEHPRSGTRVPELKRSRHRQIIEPPCRIFYRIDGNLMVVLHAMRGERVLRTSRLAPRKRSSASKQSKRRR